MKMKLLMTAIASVAAFSATTASAQDCSTGVNTHTVYYNHDSAKTAEIQNQLDQIVNWANSCAARSIQVVCHTDTTGAASYNQALSERRAIDVMNELVSRGVSQSIISTSGEGERNNVVDRGDNAKEQLNRRCDFRTEFEPVYQETVQYEQPVRQTETIVEQKYINPEPIESTQQVVTRPAPTPEKITTSVPSGTTSPSVAVPSSAPPLPPVSSGGGVLGGISPGIIAGGLAAVVAAGVIIADDDDDDDDLPASP